VLPAVFLRERLISLLVARLSTLPAQPAAVDFASYKARIGSAALVEGVEKAVCLCCCLCPSLGQSVVSVSVCVRLCVCVPLSLSLSLSLGLCYFRSDLDLDLYFCLPTLICSDPL
jgi:hypothetical protein